MHRINSTNNYIIPENNFVYSIYNNDTDEKIQTIKMQNGDVKSVGINGCSADDLVNVAIDVLLKIYAEQPVAVMNSIDKLKQVNRFLEALNENVNNDTCDFLDKGLCDAMICDYPNKVCAAKDPDGTVNYRENRT